MKVGQAGLDEKEWGRPDRAVACFIPLSIISKSNGGRFRFLRDNNNIQYNFDE